MFARLVLSIGAVVALSFGAGVLLLFAATNSRAPRLALEAPPLPSPHAHATAPAIIPMPAPAAASAAAPEASVGVPAAPQAPAEARPALPPPEPQPPPAAPSVMRFVIDPSLSLATYIVGTEALGGRESSAAGTTSAISGQIYLSEEDLDGSEQSSFRVDLRTLQTGDILLQQFLRLDLLNTRQYPYAEFRIESASGFPPDLGNGSEFGVSLTGTLSLRGVSRPSRWNVRARQAGNVLTATAETGFRMSDFGITPPNAGVIRAKDDVRLHVVLVARRDQ